MKAERCQKTVCAYFESDRCGAPDHSISQDDFKQRRGNKYFDYSGQEGLWPCSSKYMGFQTPHDHYRYINEIKRNRLTFICTITFSCLAFILSSISLLLHLQEPKPANKLSNINQQIYNHDHTIQRTQR
jgi:hypothetical protein